VPVVTKTRKRECEEATIHCRILREKEEHNFLASDFDD